jgi:hypothetical protein
MLTQVVPTSQTSTLVEVKTEEFTTILERITESFVKALTAASTARQSDRPPRPSQSGSRSNNCHFCDLPDHYGRDCEVTADYINQGKCKRNIEGRITIRRIHRRMAPSQPRSDCCRTVDVQRTLASSLQTSSDISDVTDSHMFNQQTILSPQLSMRDRIDSLEREVLQLRNRKFEGTGHSKGKASRCRDS